MAAKRRRVLFVASTLQSSGPINVIYNIVKNLDEGQFEPLVLTLSPESSRHSSSYEHFKNLGIELYSLHLSRFSHMLMGKSAFQKMIEQLSLDVIHTHGIRADIAASQLVRDRQAPLRVSTIHNYPYQDYPLIYGKPLGLLMARRHIKALCALDAPIACSTSVFDMLIKHELTTSTIQNGVDTEKFFALNRPDKHKLRAALGLPTEKAIYISVGHLSKRKAPEVVVNAFLASKACESGCLLFLGDGELRSACEKLMGDQSKGDIRFLGIVNNVADYLRAGDCFISASIAEGLPNSVLEALACGLPVLLSDISAHREILDFDQGAGALFDVGRASSLKSLLDKAVDSSLQLDPLAPTSIVEKHLSARAMTRKYQMVYQHGLKGLEDKVAAS